MYSLELDLSKKNFIKLLNNCLKNNYFVHAYLIEIDNYEDDFKYVLTLVKALLCENENINDLDNLNCNNCNICSLIDSDNYPDLYIIEGDDTTIKKEQIIKLEDEFKNTSLLKNKRIYIIKESEKMNDSSSNTLLKFLEEPNDNIVAILLTKDRYKLLPTIISRCQIISLKSSNIVVDNSNMYLNLIRYLIDGEDLFLNYDSIIEEYFIGDDKDGNKKILKSNLIIHFNNVCNILMILFYSNLIVEKEFKFLDKLDKKKILNIVDIIQRELIKLNYNVNSKIWLDSLYSKIIGGIYD